MNRYLILLSSLFLLILSACSGSPSITLDADGEGTSDTPYRIEMYIDEIKLIALDVPEEVGTLTATETVATNEEATLTLTLTASNQLVINATKAGVFVILLHGSDEEETVHLEVTVMKRDIDFNQQLKVLAIGNSFSEDAMEYLYQVADDYGVEDITLGILYIGGSPISTHVDMLESGDRGYTYYKNTSGFWNYSSSYTMMQGLIDEEWDIITIQQASYDSGQEETYNDDIDTLIDFIDQNKTNPSARIVWHMTWAYQSTSTHSGFINYDHDQLTMYNAILNAVQTKILTNDKIEYVIPAGTAIQNARTSYFGDWLTRDGYHLSLDKGRYIAALTWFHTITGFTMDDITYRPEGVSEDDLVVMIEAVNNAVDTPYEVTTSSYPTE